MRTLLLLLLLTLPILGQSNHYIRAGAAGNDSGSDWLNAFPSFPATLTRGDTYYVADGAYSDVTFDDAESGTTVIYIKKATEASHGTDTGWDSTYGDGQATWTTNGTGWYITTGYYDFEGYGGGSDSWESGHGFEITTTAAVTANERCVQLGGFGTGAISNVRFSGIKMAGQQTLGYSTGLYAVGDNKTNITIENCWITGHGKGLIRAHYAFSWLIQRCAMTDTATSNASNHGSGITFWFTCDDNVVQYNRFRAVKGTGWIGFYQDTPYGFAQDNNTIHGNVFYGQSNDGTNGVIYSNTGGGGAPAWSNFSISHNTFYSVGALPLIAHTGTDSGSVAYNNTAYNCPGNFVNGITTVANNVKQGSDIFVDGANGDLHLTQETATNGTTLGSPYNVDMDGVTRGQGTSWDIGAFEYVAGGAGSTLSAGTVTIGP